MTRLSSRAHSLVNFSRAKVGCRVSTGNIYTCAIIRRTCRCVFALADLTTRSKDIFGKQSR